MYAAAAGERLITIEEASQVYKISRGHMMKIANVLTRAGYLHGVRGRSGGLMLAKRPEDIRLGDVFGYRSPTLPWLSALAPTTNASLQSVVGFPMS